MRYIILENGYNSNERGFTLLISIIISSLILAIGLSILNITLKEFILSSIARESEYAFYAADAGMECALYWDGFGRNRFGSSAATPPIAPTNIRCAGSNVKTFGGGSDVLVGGQPYGIPSQFEIRWGTPEVCVQVEVTKTLVADVNGNYVRTVVESRGRNNCDLNDPRTVERALRASY